jgi:myosin heavy subunit
MAESGKITREDIIAKDAFTSAVEEAKELLKVVTDIQNALKTKAKQSTEGFAIASPQTLDDVAKLTKQIEDLKKEIEALNAVKKKQKKAEEELTQIEKERAALRAKLNKLNSDDIEENTELNLLIKQQNQANKERIILNSNMTTTYEKQVTRLAQIKRELKTLSTEGKKAPEELLSEFKKLDGSVRKAEESVKEFHRSIGNYSSATAELKDLTRQLIDLERAGQRDTAAFRDMRQRAAELKDTIADTKAEITTMASDTQTIDGMVGSVNLLANAYQVTEGALVLLGENSEEWKETMVKLQAIMAVTTGIQEIQNLLQKESAAMMFLNNVATKAAAAAQGIYAFAVGASTGAMKAFRIALLATGVGALIVGIAALAGAFDDLGLSVEEETEKQKKLTEAILKTDDAYKKIIEKSDKLRARSNEGVNVLNRELIILKAKGATQLEIFNKEQEIRREELFRLKASAETRFQTQAEIDANLLEALDLEKQIKDKQTEIEAARLEFERAEREKSESSKIETVKNTYNEVTEIKEQAVEDDINNAEETQRIIDETAIAEMEANEEAYNQSVLLAEQEAAKKKEIEDKALADKKKAQQDELAQERRVQQQVLQGIEQGTKRRSEIVQNGLNAEIKKQDEAVQRQQELAAQGLDNTLAYQEKKREELQVKLEREKEAERRREEALQLAGAFLGSYQSRLDNKQNTTQALAGALADTLIAKAISSTIAGAFAGGVEDFQGKGTGTSDSNLIAFSHGESVVTAKATQQYSGLVTAMNKGLVDDYVKQMILPDMDAPMKSNGNSFQSAAIVYTLTKELGELKQAIKNKQEIKVNWNAQGERVEEIVKDGMKTVIKHVTTGKRRL